MDAAEEYVRSLGFVAQIKFSQKVTHLGYYDTAEEAHAAYRNAAEKHFGEFARFA